ncbi:hypothetical protein HQ560_01050 [bacterium]|nr:hypothetical protein [bacterium]
MGRWKRWFARHGNIVSFWGVLILVAAVVVFVAATFRSADPARPPYSSPR